MTKPYHHSRSNSQDGGQGSGGAAVGISVGGDGAQDTDSRLTFRPIYRSNHNQTGSDAHGHPHFRCSSEDGSEHN